MPPRACHQLSQGGDGSRQRADFIHEATPENETIADVHAELNKSEW